MMYRGHYFTVDGKSVTNHLTLELMPDLDESISWVLSNIKGASLLLKSTHFATLKITYNRKPGRIVISSF